MCGVILMLSLVCLLMSGVEFLWVGLYEMYLAWFVRCWVLVVKYRKFFMWVRWFFGRFVGMI